MIIYNSAHGKFELPLSQDKQASVMEFLRINRIPINSVSIYGQNNDTGPLNLIVGLEKKIDDLASEYTNIIVQPDRNINMPELLNRPLQIVTPESDGQLVGEYILDELNEGGVSNLTKFTVEQAKNYVNKAVKDVLEETKIDFSKKIVFGISGGGDSNTLLEAFVASGFPKENLVPVMVHGIPDMDQGTDRAREISREQGLSLIELSAADVDSLLGRDKSNGTWASDYEKIFDDDLESIATFVIRIGLSSVAKEYGAQAIVTGLNLEDILAESLTLISKGYVPARFPERQIFDTRIIYPLYRVPKKIIDATHPQFSLENYIQRFPSKSHWRAAFYYLAQSVSNILPGMEFRLLDGFKTVANSHELNYQIDPRVKWPVLGELDDETVKLWEKFIKA